MTKEDLIEKLKRLPDGAIITTWDPYHDCQSYSVHLSVDVEGKALIASSAIGDEI